MLGLFNTLNLGARALQAQETGLEVTGQNLSNVNNPACSRQRVQISTSSTTSPTFTSSLSDQLNSLFNAFQSVVTDPTSTAQRQALVNQTQSLTESLNQASQSLTSLNGSLNTTLNNNVTSANQLLSDIAGLNDQIA